MFKNTFCHHKDLRVGGLKGWRAAESRYLLTASQLHSLLASYLFDIPSGAVIIIVSTLIFTLATLVSPKRKVMKWEI